MTVVRELTTLLNFDVDDREAKKWEGRIDGFARKASAVAIGIGTALAAAFSIDKIVQAGDAYTTTMNRLGASTASAVEATQAFEGLYTSARETGIAVDESSKAFMRFSPAMQKLGYGMSDTISLIDGLQKGLLAAGATAQESGSVFQQLGQAINANVFQGEELGSFLENASPTLVSTFAEALGTTSDKLKELGSEGKLTAKNVLPAMLQAAKAGRDEFGRMRVTVGLAMARSGVAVDRFTAELERAFRFTEILARGIEAVGQKIDQWRSYIPSIGRVVNELGGLESILRALGYGIVFVTGVTLALNGALSALIVRAAVLAAPFLAFSAAIVLAGAMIDDFIKWVKNDGTKTLFGDWFGDFDSVVAPLKSAFDEVSNTLASVPGRVKAAWDWLKAYLKQFWNDIIAGWPDWVKGALGLNLTSSQDPAERRRQAGGAGGEETASPATNWFYDTMRPFLGALGMRQRIIEPDGTELLLPKGGDMLGALNDNYLRRFNPAGSTVSTQNNSATVTNNVTVNATGVSGPEVAAATQRGMDRALFREYWLENMAREARGARMAHPGVESR
ncbi:tape measure protein [Teichococcus aestuarii]|uniref:Tape measure protein N-terminal domain-containing protein n=1 Tax=Teichococcus aestuarii TaxID=568898 RepID=A0A2U1UZ69_9PROT|nr:tape measure protein [Pseudoroseomonas aestuarii]PWC26956.1 hypothetical protein CR165_20520 [Pseudoroseomonas aestuarii]